jgi:hypothetical protein
VDGEEIAIEEIAGTPRVPVAIEADLKLPNALGPETHAYQTMAVHLYMKRV